MSISCSFFFFFSSRRRHTRCSRDCSSDVCSSDLAVTFLQTRWQKTFAPSHHSLVGALIDPDLSRGFEIVGDPVFPVSQAILLGKNQCPYLVLGVKELRQDSLFQAIGNDRRNSRRR